jgi:acyl carrier protein
MNDIEARAAIAAAPAGIAPEVDLGSIDAAARLRDEIDLDSLDFLNLVQALHDSTGIDIPEADYPRVESLTELMQYLVAHSERTAVS